MRGAVHMQITTIGLDIAKNVFQVHGIDADEKVVVRKQLRRAQVMKFFVALPRCLVGMEACATAHYWARELTRLGHQVRLMPAKDVKAYVKRNKNDAADAEAICEAVRRPTMRFVEGKSAEQQGRLMQHRTRDLLVRQRTQTINALRAHMAELGIVAAQGPITSPAVIFRADNFLDQIDNATAHLHVGNPHESIGQCQPFPGGHEIHDGVRRSGVFWSARCR
jgi:transposase